MINEAVKQFESTTQHLLHVISSFTQQQLNMVPFEGSWTPAQVADHIIKSQLGFTDLFCGRTIPANRRADEKNEAIGKVFLDYTIKMQAPEFILPSKEPQDKNTLMDSVKNKSIEIIDAVQNLDPTEICLDFELPGFGKFTRLEWIYFIMYHAQRHTHQLENIYKKMNNQVLSPSLQ